MSNVARARWEASVGTVYRATDEAANAHELTLYACSPLRSTRGWDEFALTFVSEPGMPAAQGVYALAVGDAEPEAVFLVPTGRTGNVVEFEAVFNQVSEVSE